MALQERVQLLQASAEDALPSPDAPPPCAPAGHTRIPPPADPFNHHPCLTERCAGSVRTCAPIDKIGRDGNSVPPFYILMNRTASAWRGAAWTLALAAGSVAALAFVSETERELVGTGDFDGNGKQDVVIFDRGTGKYRLGYQNADGTFAWVNYRVSGLKDPTWLTVGHLVNADKDAIAVTPAEANLVHILDAADAGSPAKPVAIPYETLGPGGVVAVDIGGAGNTPLDDLAVGSVYNDPNKLSLLRNDGSKFTVQGESDIKAAWIHPTRASLKAGGPALVIGLWSDDAGDAIRISDFKGGTAATVAEAGGVPKGSDFVIGAFRGGPLADVVTYKKGETAIQYWALAEADGKLKVGEGKAFDLGKPIKVLVTVPKDKGAQLLAIFGKGETAEVYNLDGASAPASVQTIAPRQGDALFGAAAVDASFLVFSAADYMKFATHAQTYQFAGTTNAAGVFGKLASMADNDDATVPEIHKHLVEVLGQEGIKAAADMKLYTNTIPGSVVNYVMVPIPGGEFTMGSPDGEKGRNADEGPQRKVKISPFWMGKFEVSWNEYELFMFPDDERKLRTEYPTPEGVNKVSDAVTRPSKPYMEMSFGMGKDGYPAISMTQHAANKFCHWLSAKTGHFYRLPTEAEWEYACRAGTTTAYFFGDDDSKLGEYAAYEANSDFKYSKIGRKKPNPWGLHDMHGNVTEWCLDQYAENYDPVKDALVDPWNRATKPYPHVVRGGSYDDDAVKLRSAARRGSDKSWKMRDPQLPKSIWWLTDAQFLGFRLVRPLNIPSAADLQKVWTSGVEKE